MNDTTKKYVHMLNSTLTATERTMCCIVENYQREGGIEVPEVLRNYMGGKSFIPYQKSLDKVDKVTDGVKNMKTK
jgi:seryl-tRNA synthetase